MDFNKYQEKTRLTDVGPSKKHGINPPWLYYVLGIGGETGELFENIKKHFRDDYGKMTKDRFNKIKKEMGDMLWYQARLADYFGIEFNEIARDNISKLLDRKKRKVIHGDGDDR